MSEPAAPMDDPDYKAAIVDLLGALAYGEVAAFERLAQDSELAPGLADRTELQGMAATEFGHYRKLADRLASLGADPVTAMVPFQRALDEFHDRTAPADWFEALVKAYVGEGLTADFYREIAANLDEDTRALILEILDDEGQAAFAVDRVKAGIAADSRLAGRLALFGRRLMGEALVQGQSVAAERDALTAMLAGGVGRPGFDLATIGRLFTRLTENHVARMGTLGLAP